MFGFNPSPDLWFGGLIGLIAGMVVMAVMSFLVEDAEYRRMVKRAAARKAAARPRRVVSGWEAAASEGIGPVERPRSARSELRSRPR